MKQRDQSLLWQIQHPNQVWTSYLFGTMHVKNDRFFAQLDPVYEAINACHYFAAEYDFSEAPTTIPPELYQLPPGKKLSDYLSQKKYEKLERILWKSFRIPLKQFERLLPLFVINLITQHILAQNSAVSLDEHLWQYAQTKGKEGVGVERFAEQLAVLQKIDIETQVQLLVKLGKNVKSFRQQLLKTADIYQSGDIRKLYKVTKKSTGKMRKTLLYHRNLIMAERITQWHQNDAICAAIGAAHLAGEKGVLRYLKQRGFQLQPIPLNMRK